LVGVFGEDLKFDEVEVWIGDETVKTEVKIPNL